jgi:hypothetical protein
MNGAEVLDVGRDAIWLTIQLSAPAADRRPDRRRRDRPAAGR